MYEHRVTTTVREIYHCEVLEKYLNATSSDKRSLKYWMNCTNTLKRTYIYNQLLTQRKLQEGRAQKSTGDVEGVEIQALFFFMMLLFPYELV